MNQANTYDLLAPVARWSAPGAGLKVDSRLMQGYSVQNSMEGVQLAVVQNSDGQNELITVGPDGNLNNYYPDSTSDTGWSKSPLGLNVQVNQFYQVAAGKTAEGNLIVFVVTGSSFTYIVQNPGGENRWSAPQQLPIESSVQTKITCKNINGQLYLGIVKTDSDKITFHYGCWNSSNPDLGKQYQLNQSNGFSPLIGWTAGASSGGVQLVVCMNGGIHFFTPQTAAADADAMNSHTNPEIPGSPGVESDIPPNPQVVAVSVVDDASGNTVLFGIFEDGNLYFLDSAKQNGSWLWNARLSNLSNNTSLWEVQGSLNESGQLEAFAVSNGSDQLYHIRRDPESAAGWTNLVDLGFDFWSIAVGRNADGYSQVFGATGNRGVVHIWQNPDTTDWEAFVMKIEEKGKMEEFISYGTEITVLDADAQPSPHQAVKIWSPDRIILTINGKPYRIDANRPAVCRTNAAGQITIASKTETLSAPLLKVWTGLMEPTDSVVIEPNIDVQNNLKTLTQEKLLDARDADGAYLLQGTLRDDTNAVKDMTNAITQSMTLVSPTIGTNKNNLARPGETAARGLLTYLPMNDPNFSHKIDLNAVPDQHWKLDFSTGKPVFTSMTREETEAAIAETLANRDGGFLGFDWGDVWESIKSGVNELTSYIVEKVESGIHVVISFGKYVWDGIISFVEQAFDLIEGIFEQIKVSFERLFEWLGFLFDWQDIIRTKEVVKHIVNQGFDVMRASLQFVKVESDSYFNTLKAQITDSFNRMIQNQLGKESIKFASDVAAPPGVEKSNSLNVVSTTFQNNLSDSGSFPGANLEARAMGALEPLDNLISDLTNNANQFQQDNHFQNALDYFQQAAQQLKTNPGQALHTTFAGFLETLSGLAHLAVELIQQVIDSILNAVSNILTLFQEFLNAPWDIPFVSDLYNYVTGGTLTSLDLMSLIVAVPTTILYKAVDDNDWILPDQASVDNFKSIFTSDALIEAMRINDSARGETDSPKVNKLAYELNKSGAIKLFIFLNLGGYIVYGIACGCADLLTAGDFSDEPTQRENSISVCAIIFEILNWVTSCPYLSDESLVTRPQLGTPSETAALAWVFGLFGWTTDLVVFSYHFSKQRVDLNNKKYRRGKKSSLSGNAGVIIGYIPVVTNLVLYSILASTQVKAGKYNSKGTAINFLSVTPGVFGFLRIKQIANSTYGGAARGALAGLDILCNLVAGILTLVQYYNPSEQSKENTFLTSGKYVRVLK